jgi:ATP-dependent RNA helicase DDX28
MDTLKKDINPRFQLADIRAFSLPSTPRDAASSTTALEWKDLELREDLVRGLTEGLKLKTPLPSQIAGIPALMKLKTTLFAAPTGCGKTLTYLLPLFQNLKAEEEDHNKSKEKSCSGPRALILVPTHELVRQVYATAKALSHYAKLRVETIDTVFKHKNPNAADSLDILITTPRTFLRNRIEGPFNSNYKYMRQILILLILLVKTGSISKIIVDEADTLLSADFASDVKEIMSSSGIPEKLRVLATSATITRQLQRTMTSLFPDLKIHMTSGLHAAVPNLRQRFLTINQPGNAKMQQVLQILQDQPTSRVIIFCNKLVKAEALHKFLCDNLIISNCDEASEKDLKEGSIILPSLFHGHLPPIQRASIIEKFASGSIRTLICTDLAARGLDTPWVNHVINFDFPRSLQDYLHRAGRTARAGRGGAITSLVTAKDRALHEYIELAAKQRRIFSDPL